MPGLAGAVSVEKGTTASIGASMLELLSYGRASTCDAYHEDGVAFGCAHLGTGGQRMLYESPQACVALFGYLTEPVIQPLVCPENDDIAARSIHDRYLKLGEKVFSSLEGAYAAVIWDRRTSTLLIGCDRMGLRPVYYAEHQSILRFASEVKGILVDPSLPHVFDHTAAADYFHFRYVIGDRTLFENIKLIPPASYLCWHEGKWQIKNYWMPTYAESFPRRSTRWYDEQIITTLQEAMRRAINPSLRYGISLSSGIDSRWLSALLQDLRLSACAFTFQGAITSQPEFEIASRVAELTRLDHYHQILAPNFLAESAEDIVFISDGMQSLVDSQEFSLVGPISQKVDISIGGFMGSGFFGQNPLLYFVSPENVFDFQQRRIRSWIPERLLLEKAFGKENYASLENAAFNDLKKCNDETPARHGFQILNHQDIFQRQRRFTFTAQLLKTPFVDMIHPIADRRVWDLHLQLPPSQLMYKRAFRHALGRYYPDLGQLPWNKLSGRATRSVLSIFFEDGTNRISKTIYAHLRPYQNCQPGGHLQDYSDWFRGPLRSIIEPLLFSDEANALGLIDPSGFRGLVQDYFDCRVDITSLLGTVLPFIMWTKMFYLPSTPLKTKLAQRPIGIQGG